MTLNVFSKIALANDFWSVERVSWPTFHQEIAVRVEHKGFLYMLMVGVEKIPDFYTRTFHNKLLKAMKWLQQSCVSLLLRLLLNGLSMLSKTWNRLSKLFLITEASYCFAKSTATKKRLWYFLHAKTQRDVTCNWRLTYLDPKPVYSLPRSRFILVPPLVSDTVRDGLGISHQ